jgi:hypothetical protein
MYFRGRSVQQKAFWQRPTSTDTRNNMTVLLAAMLYRVSADVTSN